MYPIEILNGILNTILVIMSIFIGIRIILKYAETKVKTYLYFGITWILIVQAWYPSVTSFILNIFTQTSLTLEAYILFLMPIPFSVLFGVISFSELVFRGKQKLIFEIFLVYAIAVEIGLISMFIIDPLQIGSLYGAIDIEFSLFTKIYMISVLLTIIPMGVLFTRESFNAKDKEVRFKGKFLFVAFIVFPIGMLIEFVVPFNTIDLFLLIITKIFVLSGSFLFLLGFHLPKFIKKIFNI